MQKADVRLMDFIQKARVVCVPTTLGVESDAFLLMLRSSEGLFLIGCLRETTLHPFSSGYKLECEILTDAIGYSMIRHACNGGSVDIVFMAPQHDMLQGWCIPQCLVYNLYTSDQIEVAFTLEAVNVACTALKEPLEK